MFGYWVWQLWGWLLKHRGQRPFEAAWDLLIHIGRPMPGGAGWHTRASYYIWFSTEDTSAKEPHLWAVWEVPSQQPHSIFFYASVLNFMVMELIFASFTAAHRTISFLEPLCCSLRVKCMIVKKHIGNCIRICPNCFCIYPKPTLILHMLRKGLLSACLECSSCSILPAVQLARKVSKFHICTAGSASWEMLQICTGMKT